MTEHRIPLSILDVAPVVRGATPADAFRNSGEMVQVAERLGYKRFWVAEHHNMPSIASASPPVLLAHLGALTSTIRLGSGGVMLPNHAPMTVAEQFGILEGLHPGRIDLGLGRAPGTDPLTAQALRRSLQPVGADDFPEQMTQLLGFFEGEFPPGHPYANITAVPAKGQKPELWILGSSTYGAQAAALLGMPYSFAYHFAPAMVDDAVAIYRRSFRPSPDLAESYLMMGASVICGENDAHAEWLAKPGKIAFLGMAAGRSEPYATPELAADYKFTPYEQQVVDDWSKAHIIGGPDTVRAQLDALLDRTGADELMIGNVVWPFEERVASFERLASLYSLSPVA